MNLIPRKIKRLTKRALLKRGTEIKITKLGNINSIYHQNYSSDSIVNRRFYNVSAGGHSDLYVDHPYWTNLDLEGVAQMNDYSIAVPQVVPYDMLFKQNLPIDNNSAEIILSQYSIEHVPDEAAEFFFQESFRVLKSNGLLRVVAPNIDLDMRAYKNNDRSYFFWDEWYSDNPSLYGLTMPMNQASLEQVFISHFAAHASEIHIADNPDKIGDEEFRSIIKTLTNEEVYNYCTSRCKVQIQENHRYNHINWWSYDKLINALKKTGFKDVYIAGPLQSSAHIFRKDTHFEKKPNFVALTVEAIK